MWGYSGATRWVDSVCAPMKFLICIRTARMLMVTPLTLQDILYTEQIALSVHCHCARTERHNCLWIQEQPPTTHPSTMLLPISPLNVFMPHYDSVPEALNQGARRCVLLGLAGITERWGGGWVGVTAGCRKNTQRMSSGWVNLSQYSKLRMYSCPKLVFSLYCVRGRSVMHFPILWGEMIVVTEFEKETRP